MSYITGTHNFKAGVDLNQFSQGRKSYDDPWLVNQAISYTFRNQLPVSVSIYTGPYGPYQEGTENGAYVQDQWTMRRMTLNLGLRYAVYDVVDPGIAPAGGPVRAGARFPGSQALAPLGKSQPASGRRLRPVWHRQDGDQGGAGPVSSRATRASA